MEQAIWRRKGMILICVGIGFTLEFLLIPIPHNLKVPDAGLLRFLFTSRDFYYASALPFIVCWFVVFLRRRPLKPAELALAFGLFGFYLCSALRAIAITLFEVVRFGDT